MAMLAGLGRLNRAASHGGGDRDSTLRMVFTLRYMRSGPIPPPNAMALTHPRLVATSQEAIMSVTFYGLLVAGTPRSQVQQRQS